jgi:hypothetical protein
MKLFDTLGGTILTHIAVGVGAFLVGRGWATPEQAHALAIEAQTVWPAYIAAGGGAAAAVAGKLVNRD